MQIDLSGLNEWLAGLPQALTITFVALAIVVWGMASLAWLLVPWFLWRIKVYSKRCYLELRQQRMHSAE